MSRPVPAPWCHDAQVGAALRQAVEQFRATLPAGGSRRNSKQACPFAPHVENGHQRPSIMQGLGDAALLQQLSACLHSVQPTLREDLIPPLLELFAVGLVAGRTKPQPKKPIVIYRRHASGHGAAHPAARAAHRSSAARRSSAVASTTASMCFSTRSSNSGLLATLAQPPHTCAMPKHLAQQAHEPNRTSLDACMRAIALPGHHPMSNDASVSSALPEDLSGHMPAGHPGVDWSQPISASMAASGGCPFMSMLKAQRAAAPADECLVNTGMDTDTSSGPTPHAAAAAAAMFQDSAGSGGAVAAPSASAYSPGSGLQSDHERAATFAAVTGSHEEGPVVLPAALLAELHRQRSGHTLDAPGGNLNAHMALPSLLDEFPSMSEALYSKLGSWDGLVAAIDGFYSRMMGDEKFKHCYAHLPARSYMTRKLSCFLAFACSGRLPYDARTLWRRHSELIQTFQLTPEDVDSFAAHLHDTLEDVGIHPDVVEMATKLVLQYRDLFHPSVTAASFDALPQQHSAST